LSTFQTRSRTFLCYQCTQKRHSNQWTSKPPKSPLPSSDLNSQYTNPGPTPLTIPNCSSTALHTFTQLRHKVPIGYNWMPYNIHPKITTSFGGTPPEMDDALHWGHLTHIPNDILIASTMMSLYTIHTSQTDRQTAGASPRGGHVHPLLPEVVRMIDPNPLSFNLDGGGLGYHNYLAFREFATYGVVASIGHQKLKGFQL